MHKAMRWLVPLSAGLGLLAAAAAAQDTGTGAAPTPSAQRQTEMPGAAAAARSEGVAPGQPLPARTGEVGADRPGPVAQEPAAAPPAARRQVGPKVPVERIDAFRARIGSIVLDRRQRLFTVPGRVIWERGPLEFLAVTEGGAKAYESVLALDTDAIGFNIACLLIGLDSDWKRGARFHFDPEPAQGESLAVLLRWEWAGQRHETPAHELFEVGGGVQPGPVWIYTGSRTVGDRYLAQQDGTLIGLAHDPASVIEHREGMGLGNYGSVSIRPGLLPPPGTPVELEVRRLARQEAGMPIPQGETPHQTPAPAIEGPATPHDTSPTGDSSPGPTAPTR